MPRYAYRCDFCKETFEITHGMFFELEVCSHCHRHGGLEKLPNVASLKTKKKQHKKRTGQVVDEYIKTAREEVKEEKKRLKDQVYDD